MYPSDEIAAAIVAFAGAAWLWRRSSGAVDDAAVRIENPFELWVAIRFGVLLAAIMLLTRLLPGWLGDSGLYLLAAVSGLGDVDAIGLSMARQAGNGVALQAGAIAVAIAALANTVTKAVLALAIGRAGFAVPLAAVLAAGIGAGIDAIIRSKQVIYERPTTSARWRVSPLLTPTSRGARLSLRF